MAQTLPVSEGILPEAFLSLRSANRQLRENALMMEQALDLVQPYTTDTFVWPETQRLRFPGSDVLESAAGLRWQAITLRREKLIGKVFEEISNYRGFGKEFDVNYMVVPQLPRYADQLYDWWGRASEEGRQISKSYEHNAPFEVPEKLKLYDSFFYAIECENTPHRPSRDTLFSLFYPCKRGASIATHPNFGYPYPSIGFYGPAVMDCNHTCKPEIHPYEWIWWLKVNPKEDEANRREWMAGFIRDWSGRFRDWSTKPRKGIIRLPFAFALEEKIKILQLDHLYWDKFVPAALKTIPGVPADALDGSKTSVSFTAGAYGTLELHTNQTVPNSGLRYWISDLVADKKAGILGGYLNIAVAVENLYLLRMETISTP